MGRAALPGADDDGRGREGAGRRAAACGAVSPSHPETRRQTVAGPPILRTAFIGTIKVAEPPQAVAAKVEGRRSAPLWRPEPL